MARGRGQRRDVCDRGQRDEGRITRRGRAAARVPPPSLDLAYGAYPERFTHGVPRVALPPAAVHINPLTADALTVLPVAAAPDETSTKVSSLIGRSKLLAALRRPTLVAAIAT